MIYFVYETTNLINDKKYRGIHKTEKIEDGYLGSGISFTKAVEKYGKGNFSRKILEFCESYDELIEREKFYVDDNWVNDYSNYNLKTGGQSAGILSDESKSRISKTLKRKYDSGEIKAVGPPKGNIPWNKGLENIYSEKIIEKMSISAKKRYLLDNNHAFKISPNRTGNRTSKPQTKESNRKRSETLKERYKTQEHPSKGIEPWNKGKTGVQEAWNKGKKMEKIECPHCGKKCDKLNAKKWHFEKCKNFTNK